MAKREIVKFDKSLVSVVARVLDQGVAEVSRGMAEAFMAGVVPKTPRKIGRAQSGWKITIGAPSTFDPGPNNVGDIGATDQELKRIDGKSLIYVTNAVPYIRKLNNGYPAKTGGRTPYAGKAGVHMSELTYAEVQAQLSAIIEKARAKLDA